jgi:hypothetical protein
MTRARYLLYLLLLFAPVSGLAQNGDDDREKIFDDELRSRIRADFRHHYREKPLFDVAVGFGITALLANSDADENIQRFVRDKLQGRAGDSLANVFTDTGDLAQPIFSIPIYLAAMWVGDGRTAGRAAQWGENSLRAVLIGTPELVALALIAGGQRPEEGEPGWSPFDGDNGVSGHAFYGAVPIITAARMTDKRWLKTTLYIASALPGLARVYEDKHYASQAFMGWWLAHVAARSVEHSNAGPRSNVSFAPLLLPNGGGLQVRIRFQ